LGRTVGYPIAAGLIWVGSSLVPLYLIDAATFVSAALLTLMAGPLGGGIRSKSVMGAFRSSFAVPQVRPHLVVAAVGAFGIYLTAPAVIVLAYQLSSNGAGTYTILEVVLTVGMLAGAVAFAWLAPRARTAVLLGLALMGVLCVATAASPYLVVTGALLFAASVGNQLYFIGNRTQLQQAAPRDAVGSIMATRGVVVQTLAIVGTAVGGALSTFLGPRWTYGVAGAGLLGLAIAIGQAQSRSRAERQPPRKDEEARTATRPPSMEVAETA
jgi:MFS family permease